MGNQLYKNNAASQLSAPLAIGSTTLNLASGQGARFPTPTGTDYFLITLYEKSVSGTEITYEVVKCTTRVGDALTVVRDFEGIVVAAGGTSGGWGYPSAIGVNPSGVTYVEMRATAYLYGNNVTADMKDASGGVPGLTLFKLNLRNAANTITSWFTTAATVARTWTMPDKDGTIAMTSDVHDATAKTPVDADELGIMDSAASWVVKKLTLASLKAFLKTYFDTLYGGGLTGFRNKIINGDGRVAQRSALTLTTNTTGFGQCDRFQMTTAGFTTQSISLIQTNALLIGGVGAGMVSGITTTGSGSITYLTRLEAKDTTGLNGKTVTFTVVVNQQTGAALNAQLVLRKANTLDNFSALTLISAQTAVSLADVTTVTLSYTVTLGAADGSNGLQLELNFPTVGALTSKAIYQTAWQLEIGSTATTFEQRPIGTELALCYRYYQTSYPAGVAPGTGSVATPYVIAAYVNNTIAGFGFGGGGMRAAPTVVIYSTTGTAAKVAGFLSGTDTGTTVSAGNISDKGALTVSDSGTGFTVGTAYRFHWTASAEL
jgi:hypothetical protein